MRSCIIISILILVYLGYKVDMCIHGDIKYVLSAYRIVDTSLVISLSYMMYCTCISSLFINIARLIHV